MRNRFDQLGKQIGREALAPSGATAVNDEVPTEVQYIDLRHEPDPGRAAVRDRLGLLGQLASRFCLMELYSGTPDDADLRACLSKHIAVWQAQGRRVQRLREPAAAGEPFLWIIAAGAPTILMAKLRVVPAAGWPQGVYLFAEDVLHVGIVAASELPREASTLLVRLMAGGALLPSAIKELSALPPDAPERAVAEQILLRWQAALRKKSSRTSEEQEFIVAMENTWEKAREQGWEAGKQQGQKQGWEQGERHGRKAGEERGRLTAMADNLLTVLRVRGIAVSEAERARILGEQDPEHLRRWLERAVVVSSLAAVLEA